jgi:ABC-type multidrug transport system fused ATPase/permease subunit
MEDPSGRVVHLLPLFRAALGFFRPRERRRVLLAVAASAATALLDLAGVILLGALTSVALSHTGQSQRVSIPGLNDVSDGWLFALSIVGVTLLVGRSVLAWRLNRRVLRYIARRQTEIAVDLFHRVQSAPFEEMSRLTTQSIVEGVRLGSRGIGGIVCYSVFIFGEVTLLVLMGALLLFVDPVLCLALGVFLGLVVLTTSRVTSTRLRRAGEQFGASWVTVGEVLAEAVGLSRETRLYGLADEEAKRLSVGQTGFGLADAEQQSWSQYPRYVVEVALVLSMGIIALVVWARGATPEAVTSAAVFIAASSRILPALLRLQNDVASIRSFEGQFVPARVILGLSESRPLPSAITDESSAAFVPPRVGLRGVSYRYPAATRSALCDVSLIIPAGQRTALVGKTGAGKSTLADMVLGLLEPSSGEVRWQAGAGSGVRLGFVPQDVFLTSGSIAENVALGESPDTIDLDEVWAALTSARLDSVVDSQPKGIWTLIGERGVRLSGGERQRLGVARALYRQPSLLILDEATSSVDASTEHELTSVLNGLRGRVTTLIIAHRLATIRDADLVVLLADGSVRARGSFADVAAADPAFARAATLQGLVLT